MRILAIIMLLAGCVKAEPIAVIGDSITASSYSWANVIPRQMYVMAQAGRTIRDYDMPRDWVAITYHNVVYYLGTNDILSDVNLFKVQRIFRQHIEFMQARGFKPIVILPPIYPDHTESSKVIRKMIATTCYNHDVPTIDLEGVWQQDWTRDGIHPTTSGQLLLAEYIDEQLEGLL